LKILVAADGSKYTRHALDYLTRHRGMFGGDPEVHLVHVRPQLPGHAASALGRDVVDRYYREETGKALAGAKRRLEAAGMTYREVQLVGDPGEQVAAHAKTGKFDLVVVGSHGHGTLANLVLGSVANKVLAGCKVPTLIVR